MTSKVYKELKYPTVSPLKESIHNRFVARGSYSQFVRLYIPLLELYNAGPLHKHRNTRTM